MHKKVYLQQQQQQQHSRQTQQVLQNSRPHSAQVSPVNLQPPQRNESCQKTAAALATLTNYGSYLSNSGNHLNGLATPQSQQQQLLQAAFGSKSQDRHDRSPASAAAVPSQQNIMLYHQQLAAAAMHHQQQQQQHQQQQQMMQQVQAMEYQRQAAAAAQQQQQLNSFQQQQQQQQQQAAIAAAAQLGGISPYNPQSAANIDALHNKLKARWASVFPDHPTPPFWMLLQYNEDLGYMADNATNQQSSDRFRRRSDEEVNKSAIVSRRPDSTQSMPLPSLPTSVAHSMINQPDSRTNQQMVEEHFKMSMSLNKINMNNDLLPQPAAVTSALQQQQQRAASQIPSVSLPSTHHALINGCSKTGHPPHLSSIQQQRRNSGVLPNPPVLTPHVKYDAVSRHTHHNHHLSGSSHSSSNYDYLPQQHLTASAAVTKSPSPSRPQIVAPAPRIAPETNNIQTAASTVKSLVTNAVKECYETESRKQVNGPLPPTPSNSTSSPTGSLTSTGTATPGPANSSYSPAPESTSLATPAATTTVCKMGLKKAWLKAYQDTNHQTTESTPFDNLHPHPKRKRPIDDKKPVIAEAKEEKDMTMCGPVKKRLKKEDTNCDSKTDVTDQSKQKNLSSPMSKFRKTKAFCWTTLLNYLANKPINKFPRERFEKTCEVFIQDGSCSEVCPKQVKCRECRPLQQKMTKKTTSLLPTQSTTNLQHLNANGNSIMCRFLGFRKLRYNKKGLLSVAGFCDFSNADVDDLALWQSHYPILSPSLDASTAKYILGHISSSFVQLTDEERTLRAKADTDLLESAASAGTTTPLAWKRPVKGVREMCDICDTTIFNLHWSCPKCGYTVCTDCFQYRCSRPDKVKTIHAENSNSNGSSGSDKPMTRLKNYSNEHAWQTCTANRQAHDPERLMLTCIVPGEVLWEVSQQLQTVTNSLSRGEPLGPYNSTSNDRPPSLSPCSEAPHSWQGGEQSLLRLHDSKHPGNFRLFQEQWRKGLPVIVSNCDKNAQNNLWNPKSFSKQFGTVRSNVVNCETNAELPSNPMKFFWEGFESMKRRLKDSATGEPLNLKLKDWPPADDFQSVLPDRFQDLMEILPLPEYTLRQGKLNLASRLPDFFVKPDLGPKLYNAYGMAKTLKTGTTNLHLDVADAVNVMMYVGVPEDAIQQQKAAVYAAMEKSRVCKDTIHQVTVEKRLPGALWHIFSANDVDKIRQFLNTVSQESSGKKMDNSDSDPIHDQQWYLSRELLDRLESEHSVKAYTIVQFLGDAIFIPAGAPHQVLNLHSCIKVASDFVSPENMSNCLKLTQEFRLLSNTHNNHEDKLQVKNMLYHSIKDVVAVLNQNS